LLAAALSSGALVTSPNSSSSSLDPAEPPLLPRTHLVQDFLHFLAKSEELGFLVFVFGHRPFDWGEHAARPGDSGALEGGGAARWLSASSDQPFNGLQKLWHPDRESQEFAECFDLQLVLWECREDNLDSRAPYLRHLRKSDAVRPPGLELNPRYQHSRTFKRRDSRSGSRKRLHHNWRSGAPPNLASDSGSS
jgi:hypothetical protein